MDVKKPCVAIVDDEEDVVSFMKKFFTLRKIPVSFVAYNGLEAIDRFKNAGHRPNVIIMDHRMPGANGVEVTREILALDHSVKVIFLSADGSIRDAAMAAGAVDFIKKPASMNAIVAAVRSVV